MSLFGFEFVGAVRGRRRGGPAGDVGVAGEGAGDGGGGGGGGGYGGAVEEGVRGGVRRAQWAVRV